MPARKHYDDVRSSNLITSIDGVTPGGGITASGGKDPLDISSLAHFRVSGRGLPWAVYMSVTCAAQAYRSICEHAPGNTSL